MIYDDVVVMNVRRLIADKGYKQYKVAEKANLAPRDLSAMLNGRKQILSIHIIPLAAALEVTPNDLFAAPTAGGVPQPGQHGPPAAQALQ